MARPVLGRRPVFRARTVSGKFIHGTDIPIPWKDNTTKESLAIDEGVGKKPTKAPEGNRAVRQHPHRIRGRSAESPGGQKGLSNETGPLRRHHPRTPHREHAEKIP